MKLYLSNSHSDEEDDNPVSTGKLAIIYGNKNEILEVCDFFNEVKKSLNDNPNCHMYFRDHMINWDRNTNIDIEVNTEN